MNRSIVIRKLFTLGRSGLLAVLLAGSAGAQGLINGGFDSWTSGNPDGWIGVGVDFEAHRPPFHGLFSLRAKVSAAVGAIEQTTVSATTDLALQLWWRTQGKGSLEITVRNDSGQVYFQTGPLSSNSWKPIDVRFTTAQVGESLVLKFEHQGQGSAFYLDDVRLGPEPNLIAGGDFEVWSGGAPDDWTVREGSSVLQIPSTISGSSGLELGIAFGTQLGLIQQTVSVLPLTTHYFSFDARTDASSNYFEVQLWAAPSTGTVFDRLLWTSTARLGDTIWGHWETGPLNTREDETRVTVLVFSKDSSSQFDRVYLATRPMIAGPGGGDSYREFYPTGYINVISNEPASLVAQHVAEGVNALVPYPANLTDYVAACRALGVKVAPFFCQTPGPDLLGTLVGDPDIFGFRFCDEPGGSNLTTTWFDQAYQSAKAYDPDRPIMTALFFSDIAIYSHDIPLMEFYPAKQGSPEFDNLDEFVGQSRRYLRQSIEWGKSALFALPQIFGDSFGYRFPTPIEQRYLAFAPMVHGARGVLFWSRFYSTDAHINQILKPSLLEMRSISPSMQNPAIDRYIGCSDTGAHQDPISGEPIPDINWTLRLRAGETDKYVLIVVNDTVSARQEVRFSLDLPGTGGRPTRVISSGQPLDILRNGAWSDDLGPFDAKVYWIDTEAASTYFAEPPLVAPRNP